MNYVEPYDEDKEYWTLEDAANLAYRRWEEAVDQEEEDKYKNYCRYRMRKILNEPNELEVSMDLMVFGYELERVK